MIGVNDNRDNIWRAPYAKRSFDRKGDKNIALAREDYQLKTT